MRRDQLAPAVRDRLRELPAPYANHYGVVPLPPPEEELSLKDIGQRRAAAIAAIARVDTLAETIDNPFLISRLLVRQEAVSSSAIEGTNSTLDELLRVEETSDEAASATKQVRDYVLILSRFIDRARATGSSIFTPDLVKDLHAHIMREDKSYRDRPGELREAVVWIGLGGDISRSTWNPPPPGDVEACLDQTLRYMRNEGTQQVTQDVITRMAISHAHFEAVHPFRDGNGRVGRVLLPLLMAAEGHVPLYLAPYIEARRGGYFGALKKAQQQLDWTAIVGFICEAIVDTVQRLDETLAATDALRSSWVTRRKFRRGSAALRALDVLVRYPIITITRLATELGVSYEQASKAIARLADVGIIAERTGYKRNRVFVAAAVMEIINRPYDGDVS